MNEQDFMEKYKKKEKEINNIKDLPEFLEEMLEDANDYGSIARCLGLGATATARAMDNHKHGGITGFQAGYVMWTFIREYMYSSNKTGMKIVDFDDMLYPQYDYKFEKTITSDTWKEIKKQAELKLKDTEYVSGKVVEHWKSIVDGNIPFGYKISE